MELVDKSMALKSLDDYKKEIKNRISDSVTFTVIDECKKVIDCVPSVAKTDDTLSTIYISGAITGTDNYMGRFETAENDLKLQGYRVINPAKISANMPGDTGYEDYMKVSFCLLDMCDSIYMLKGWEKSLGANREYGYALGKDMTIIEE